MFPSEAYFLPRILGSFEITSPVDEVILTHPYTDVKNSVLIFNNLASDRELSGGLAAVLAAFLSVDGETFDDGYHYINDGVRNKIPGAWPPTESTGNNQIDPIGISQHANLGCKLVDDDSDTTANGSSGEAHFFSAGITSGQDVNIAYYCTSHKGGGLFTAGPTNPYFKEPNGQVFQQPVGRFLCGHYDGAQGEILRGIKLTYGGAPWVSGQTEPWKFVQGSGIWVEKPSYRKV